MKVSKRDQNGGSEHILKSPCDSNFLVIYNIIIQFRSNNIFIFDFRCPDPDPKNIGPDPQHWLIYSTATGVD